MLTLDYVHAVPRTGRVVWAAAKIFAEGGHDPVTNFWDCVRCPVLAVLGAWSNSLTGDWERAFLAAEDTARLAYYYDQLRRKL